MKKILTSALLAVSFCSFGQIIPPVQPDVNIGGAVINTGISVSPHPGNEVHAVTFDDGSGNYRIHWVDATGTIVDADNNFGNDPDVAYYANPDALVVAFESGGNIFVDDYYLNTWTPVDYFRNTTTLVGNGRYPNVDMNSMGNGVLVWEDGIYIWACTFNIGTFTFTPPIQVAKGTQPDIVLLDNGTDVVFTYIDFSGNWTVERIDFANLAAGGYVNTGTWVYPPSVWRYEYPRIAGQRNSNYGPADFFSVVAQERNALGGYNVDAVFYVGGMIGPNLVNAGLQTCGTFEPKPVVTYETDYVHVAWGQRYHTGCTGIPFGGPGSDVLDATYDFAGGPVIAAGMYREVNQLPLAFHNSSTSIAGEYDGNYIVTSTDWTLGIAYNDPGDLFWKELDVVNPTYMPIDNDITHHDVFTLIQEPTLGTLEVQVDSEESTSFVLFDNTGRQISSGEIGKDETTYALNMDALSAGIYLLHCTSGSTSEVLRIYHGK